jgi:hypothetical protein
MIHGKKTLITPLTLLVLALTCSPLLAASHEGHQHKSHQHEGHQHPMKAAAAAEAGEAPVFAAMPAPGKKVPLEGGGYLIYEFDKKPKLGPVILKVEVYTADGKKDTSLEILGDSDMPSMRGAHETGDQPFKLSQKGVYLLPVNIVMPGDWEIRLTLKKDGQVIFRGSHGFDV